MNKAIEDPGQPGTPVTEGLSPLHVEGAFLVNAVGLVRVRHLSYKEVSNPSESDTSFFCKNREELLQRHHGVDD